MWEQSTAAGGFPHEPIAKAVGIDRDQQQISLAGKVLGGCFRHLIGSGKMNEAVREIDGRAAKDAVTFGLMPERGRTDFINGLG